MPERSRVGSGLGEVFDTRMTTRIAAEFGSNRPTIGPVERTRRDAPG